MDDSLKKSGEVVLGFLTKRTGFLGFGPSYGEIIAVSLIGWASRRSAERSVVKEAENILAEINERNSRFF